MRTQLTKLKKGKSTKGERRFGELLKQARVPFKYKIIIQGREIDFLIGNYAIEIDGHPQDVNKNKMLIHEGYNPIHFNNWEISPQLIGFLKTLWQAPV